MAHQRIESFNRQQLDPIYVFLISTVFKNWNCTCTSELLVIVPVLLTNKSRSSSRTKRPYYQTREESVLITKNHMKTEKDLCEESLFQLILGKIGWGRLVMQLSSAVPHRVPHYNQDTDTSSYIILRVRV